MQEPGPSRMSRSRDRHQELRYASRSPTSYRHSSSSRQRSRSPLPLHHRRKRHYKSRGGSPQRGTLLSQKRFRGNTYNAVRDNNRHVMGFKLLEDIAKSESQDILIKINQRRDSFFNLIRSQITRPDIFVLITELMAKISQSSFSELKLKILQEICESSYLGHFQKYLMDLPYIQTHQKAENSLYWQNQEEFWNNFVTNGECLVTLLPMLTLQKCRSLIEDSSKMCLEKLAETHHFSLTDEYSSRLALLREKLKICSEEMIKPRLPRNEQQTGDEEPPEEFRELSVIPQPNELLHGRRFLRPNIVRGGYRDSEHYLDVQFRLLREDCFGPLREGIRQYMATSNKKKIDHIRVYNNVRFIRPFIPKSQNSVGYVIQMDTSSKNWPRRISWAHSKRFLFGSLLLFTKDNCNTFIVATVLERDVRLLSQGKIVVAIVNMMKADLCYNETYVMIESEVYFEAYNHVLHALQAPDFPGHIAMEHYIVKVNPQSKPPAYLNADTIYRTETGGAEISFTVLNDKSWPTLETLGFDESQYNAYKLALTHEFAVIQGPPGTGKTFLGAKVAQTLLENVSFERGNCLILVVCYTNHALDQFLEALLPITKDIVRIGGRSRNEAIEKININNLRRNLVTKSCSQSVKREKKWQLKKAAQELNESVQLLDCLETGVLSFSSVLKFVPEVRVLIHHDYGNENLDPVKHWLFENCLEYIPDSEPISWNQRAETEENMKYIDRDFHKMNEGVLYDSDGDDEEVQDSRCKALCFSIDATESKINDLESTSMSYRERHEVMGLINILRCEINLYKKMAIYRRISNDIQFDCNSFSQMSTSNRWRLYFSWTNIIARTIQEKIPALQGKLQSAAREYEESKMIVDLELLKGAKVVGMTTSGAARLRKLLEPLGPPIVIVEEAAEVFEQHIVTSLTKHCQHLILIGDHQQLRPATSNLKLIRQYHTNISLFERMITNGIESRRLGVQHRMRPELAALISPHIYADLSNHPSTQDFPNVQGMANNLFFFTHNYQEKVVDDSSSRSNHTEGDLAMELANYLMQQGYEPDDIVILTTYGGQMFYMRKQREKYLFLSNVKITVVDNYQGEESRIVILSLVRNNPENNVGFLKIENRICVALSRAKEGLYIFGNIDTLKSNSDLWKQIADTLESKESLGTTLKLKCERHPTKIALIRSPDDFKQVPEGGCGLTCDYKRECGHKCPRLCHGFDQAHIKIKCMENCRKTCDLKHACPLKCWQTCQPCKQLVEKEFPCGHDQQVPCFLDPAVAKCRFQINVTLPDCGHNVNKECYMAIESVLCSVKCMMRVDTCGHRCGRKCHVNDDPDHEKYICQKPCARAKRNCTAALIGDRGDHQCLKKCFETCDECCVLVTKSRKTCEHSLLLQCHVDIDSMPGRRKCGRPLACGHKCERECHEPCGGCKHKVIKEVQECKHKIPIECSKEAIRELCSAPCDRIMSCGHKCERRCRENCDTALCSQETQGKYVSPCGHQVRLPCNVYNSMINGGVWNAEELLKYCVEPCQLQLACEHLCGGTCGGCYNGRLHAPCKQICNQLNICGHQCEEPCNQMCPPCNKRCEMRCSCGSRCNQLCGAPCSVPCAEKCRRSCVHGSCKNRCGEPCSRAPCDEACPRRLPCGHRCRGLCGEPCPGVCNVCRPEQFPKDFLGDPYGDNDRFITLQDCSHVFEVDFIDALMGSNPEQVKIPTCPLCRQPIINTYRYKDNVNQMFENEINPIKKKVYGTALQIKERKEALIMELQKCLSDHQSVKTEYRYWNKAFDVIYNAIKTRNKVPLPILEMRTQYVKILTLLAESYQKYKNDNLTHLQNEFMEVMKMLCCVLIKNSQKISSQQQNDIGTEIKRLNSIIQFSKILNHAFYASTKDLPEVVEAVRTAKGVVLTWKRYEEDEGLASLKKLQDVLKVTGIALKQERELIVKAIGLKAGHWYKCPNGHFYCIGECGGAMQRGRCIECNADVGGSNHALIRGNAHAPEMDGSRYAAWSEANNLENFNIDDII